MRAKTLFTKLFHFRYWINRIRRKIDPVMFVPEIYIPGNESVLCLAPHPDDEVIGAGGTLHLHAQSGDVTLALLNRGEKSRGAEKLSPVERGQLRESESRASAKMLGLQRVEVLGGKDGEVPNDDVKHNLKKLIQEVDPQIVYLPFIWDNHPDHFAINKLFFDAANELNLPDTIQVHAYEVWTPCPASCIVNISDLIELKLNALCCHATALEAVDYTVSVEGLARYRAVIMRGGGTHAEAFFHMQWKEYADLITRD